MATPGKYKFTAHKKKEDIERLKPPPQVSDSESDSEEKKAGSGSDAASDSDSDSGSEKKPAKKATKPAKPAKSKSQSSSDDDSDGSDANSDDDREDVTSAKSIVQGGQISATAVKKYHGKKHITSKVWINDQNYKPSAGITLNIKIQNECDKTVKSIQAVLQTTEVITEGKKKKKKKPVQAGKHEEWYQGARFPLDGYTDYEGTVVYTLPSALPDSSDVVIHELVVQFDVKKRIGYHHIKLILPLTIRK